MKVYIHLGYFKTGSSALQSCFAKNKDILMSNGIEYPVDKSFKAAKRGWITSGNGSLILDTDLVLSESHNYLFSGEHLFREICTKKSLESLVKRFSKHQVILICYTRDLFGHFFSTWGQYVKRGGGLEDINNFDGLYGSIYKELLSLIILSDELGVELIIKNYSRHKKNLVENFFTSVLDLTESVHEELDKPDNKVNRSLTVPESTLQRIFNKHYGKSSSRFVSDKLVNNLPLISSEQPFLSKDTYDRVIKKNHQTINQINSHLNINEQICIEDYEDIAKNSVDNGKDYYKFNISQLETLISSISNEIEKLHSRQLLDEDADRLRDIAMKFDDNELLSVNDAKYIMSLALKSRPSGPLIKQKFKEYSNLSTDRNS